MRGLLLALAVGALGACVETSTLALASARATRSRPTCAVDPCDPSPRVLTTHALAGHGPNWTADADGAMTHLSLEEDHLLVPITVHAGDTIASVTVQPSATTPPTRPRPSTSSARP